MRAYMVGVTICDTLFKTTYITNVCFCVYMVSNKKVFHSIFFTLCSHVCNECCNTQYVYTNCEYVCINKEVQFKKFHHALE